MLRIIIIITLIIILYEFIHGLYRQKKRVEIYKQALNRSKQVNKKLLVVGDPYNGLGSRIFNNFIKTYGCGDIMIDLKSSKKCKNSIDIDLLEYLKKQENNSLVIFISCVLEYIDNIEETIKEINRVANNNIFIVTVNKYSLSAYFYTAKDYQAKNIIFGPPEYKNISYYRIA